MTRNPLRDIRAALDTLMANRTSIIIAHRLSTERNTDTILVMEAGRVIKTGNHADLLTAHGAYSRLAGASDGHDGHAMTGE